MWTIRVTKKTTVPSLALRRKFATDEERARSGLGGSQGSGAQYVSWIHEADFVRAVDFLIAKETLTGAVNSVKEFNSSSGL
jgi:NAD dependent epimerase/dehydratase family enzyme